MADDAGGGVDGIRPRGRPSEGSGGWVPGTFVETGRVVGTGAHGPATGDELGLQSSSERFDRLIEAERSDLKR